VELMNILWFWRVFFLFFFFFLTPSDWHASINITDQYHVPANFVMTTLERSKNTITGHCWETSEMMCLILIIMICLNAHEGTKKKERFWYYFRLERFLEKLTVPSTMSILFSDKLKFN